MSMGRWADEQMARGLVRQTWKRKGLSRQTDPKPQRRNGPEESRLGGAKGYKVTVGRAWVDMYVPMIDDGGQVSSSPSDATI
ncbi:hypothetical protein CIB48_g5968 [Xylaria polymorpha]|nr:hypothetical protein CIB48_g5968 [Xylaria polymorpha]